MTPDSVAQEIGRNRIITFGGCQAVVLGDEVEDYIEYCERTDRIFY